MAFSFGDGYDLYAAFADAYQGYWDSGAGTPTFVAGRFSGSQALHVTATSTTLTKSSGQNDAVHHLVVAFRQTAAISGTTLGLYLQLLDGTTGQCCVVFRSDGAILLTSGTPAGTVLDTYTGAFPVTNTWYAFEVEIAINNTTGSWAVRKNGNTSNDRALGSLNTRVSANNYANKLTLGMQAAVSAQEIDDQYWQSGASTGVWLSDLRCYTRMPASDQSVQFSRTPTTFGLPPFGIGASSPTGSQGTSPRYNGFTSQGGTLTSVIVTFVTGYTGNLKCAIFACTSTLGATNSIGAILGTATAPIANPVSGANTFTFSPSITLPVGTLFYVGICSDVSSGASSIAGASGTQPQAVYAVTSAASGYASFPTASIATVTAGVVNYNCSPQFTAMNALYVSEPQQDATTSYVYDSTPGHADFYGIASIASTPVSTIAVTTRGYMIKSDAGTRTAAVQLKSGASTVASPTLVLTTSGWLWTYRTDTVDPATGAAWTAVAVNGVTIGPTTIA